MFNHSHFDGEREPGAYLRFIVTELARDPQCWARHYVFLHGHDTAWHHTNGNSIISILDSSITALRQFNASAHEACRDGPALFWTDLLTQRPNDTYEFAAELWTMAFPGKSSAANCATVPCCAQFMVSRERLLWHSIDTYKKLLRYQEMHRFTVGQNHWLSETGGRANVMEYTWPINTVQ